MIGKCCIVHSVNTAYIAVKTASGNRWSALGTGSFIVKAKANITWMLKTDTKYLPST
jgi:hypothetical protein